MKLKENKNIIMKFVRYIIIFFFIFIALLSFYAIFYFSNVTFEQLLFSFLTAAGTSETMIIGGAKYILPKMLIVLVFIIFVNVFSSKFFKTKQWLVINFREKKFRLSLRPLSNVVLNFMVIVIVVWSICSVCSSMNETGMFQYLNPKNKSSLIEDNYVNPKKVSIESNGSKQNLIYIYVESFETSFFSNENGGNYKEAVMPNLEKLTLDNLNFSDTSKIGGAFVPYGANWTIAGMVSSTSGVPLKTSGYYKNYGGFLPGAYTLGDVLDENGYSNYLLIGSPAAFGGRDDYFTDHGDYKIYDYDYAIKNKWIPSDYKEWWGYEDRKLYSFAKKELSKLAEKDEPFNFTMLTADTHADDGYLDKKCENPYDEQLLNAYNCTDGMLYDFISWIKKQDFYENTTIVIVGDHLSMQWNMYDLFDVEYNKRYERRLYNLFINAKSETSNTKNRAFMTFDLYPTTLAALGFDIEGNKLGLGVNLFSSEKTLLEKYTPDEVNEEFLKNSEFYTKTIFGKKD